MRRHFSPVLIAALSLLFFACESAEQEAVSVSVDKPGTRPSYVAGEPIVITASVKEDGYLYLFEVTPDDVVVQWLPNRYDEAGEDNAARGATSRKFPAPDAPYSAFVFGPAGTETVVAVWTREKVDTNSLVTYDSDPRFASSSMSYADFAAALDVALGGLAEEDKATAIQRLTVTKD